MTDHKIGGRPLTISVSCRAEPHSFDWSTELRTLSDEPIMQIDAKALSERGYLISMMSDMTELHRMLEYRKERSERIHGHFWQCAKQLIERIEAEEDWSAFLDHVTGKGPK